MADLSAAPVQEGVTDRPPDPVQLRDLSAPDLSRLAAGLRSFLTEHVCTTGGHLGPDPGAVDLTIAAHRVFDSPRDCLSFDPGHHPFDPGHQAYVHQLLTVRAGWFSPRCGRPTAWRVIPRGPSPCTT